MLPRMIAPSAAALAESGPPRRAADQAGRVWPTCGAGDSVSLLDGGDEAYPRMLRAITAAIRRVDLEVYAFEAVGVGASFVAALSAAAQRGVDVRVSIDGWGSLGGGRVVASSLRQAGCRVRIHNPLVAALIGRFGRDHRKVLLVDDAVAFVGGINIGDENVATRARQGWADLALEIRGPKCEGLGRALRGGPAPAHDTSLRISFCGLGGGWRLRRQYLRAFAGATSRIDIAHGYFLPDRGVVRAITRAAHRGVRVRLLLAGQSDVPFARAATRSLYRQLLAAGVSIHEWNDSVMHAKVATVDGRALLLGSFNLDRFSLANLEALVEVTDRRVVADAEAWIEDHFDRARPATSVEASSFAQRWLFDPIGRLVARVADLLTRLMATGARRR